MIHLPDYLPFPGIPPLLPFPYATSVLTIGGQTDEFPRASAKPTEGGPLYGPDTIESVMASRPEEATASLDIDEEEIDGIRRAASRRKLLIRTFSLLTPLLSFAGGLVAAGGLVRPEEPPISSYPYVAAALLCSTTNRS